MKTPDKTWVLSYNQVGWRTEVLVLSKGFVASACSKAWFIFLPHSSELTFSSFHHLMYSSSPPPSHSLFLSSKLILFHLLKSFSKKCNSHPHPNPSPWPLNLFPFIPTLFLAPAPTPIFSYPKVKVSSPNAFSSPPVASALPSLLFDNFCFLDAKAWQRRSHWLYVFIVIKLGQCPFSGTKSKWHSLAPIHTAKLFSSHNRMALSFLPIGNSPWQVLFSEPYPDTASESTP